DLADVSAIDAQNLWQRDSDLLELKGRIIDETQRVQANVEQCGDAFDRRGLRIPVYLRIQKVFTYSQLLKFTHGGGTVVLTCDRVQDAPAIQGFDDLNYVRTQ